MEPGTTAATAATAPERLRRLRRFNVAIAVVHAAQAVLMLVLSNDLALPVTAAFLPDDPVAVRGPVTPEVVFDLPIGPTVAVFLLLAAVDHLFCAAPGGVRVYERLLAGRRNSIRWVEYSVSASIMMVLIAMFTGIWSLAALVAIFGANSAMILFGLVMERQQEPETADWSAFWFGSLVGLVPWAVVLIYLLGGPQSPPGFVYAIVALEFVFFMSFAVNMVLQYAQVGRWRDYVHGEYAYVLLSLGAKSILAWLIFANVLRS